MDLYVGMCDHTLAEPFVPSQPVPCEIRGCGHKVWCAKNANEMWSVLRVVCLHCAEQLIPRAAG